MNDSIFQPNYTITSEIEFSLARLDRNRWLVDNMLLIPKHEVWLHREVRVGRAAGTTRIEGAELDEAAVSRLAKHGLHGQANDDERDNINALQAYEFVDFLSDQTDIPVDELVVRQLNRYFIATAREVLTPGAYRKGSNTVGDFQPPDQGDVPGLMRSFALWMRNDEDELHPVVKAGLAHLHLVAIHPFWDGNGRTARGLQTLLLQRSSFGFRKLLSIESTLLDLKDDYFAAIQRSLGPNYAEDYDATPWLEFSTMVVGICSEQLVSKMTDWHRMMQEAHNLWAAKGWNQRQADAYAFALQAGQISRSDYIEITGVSPVTASRDLAAMVEAGVMIPEGKTRRRIYRPVPLGSEPKTEVPLEQLPLLPGA